MKIIQVDADGNPLSPAQAALATAGAGSVPGTAHRLPWPCGCGAKLRAAVRVAKAVGKSLLDGGVRTGEELARVRAICAACETRTTGRHGREWCGRPTLEVPGVSCGCLVTFKSLLAAESCPQGKW